MVSTTLVVPTLGRPSLEALLDALAEQDRWLAAPVLLVDDRPTGPPLDLLRRGLDLRVLRSHGRGPARARNLGWRHARTPWVSFLDDDVLPGRSWYADLDADLQRAEAAAAVGSTARVQVPLPLGRRPTDWERGTAGLETARWITADLSYRRDALARVGGFDERFPRAFREDADLALRVLATHGEAAIVDGARSVVHPVRPSDDWASLRQQAGNADDALMLARHGSGWHARAGAPRGRLRRHTAVVAAGAAALAGLVARCRRLAVAGTVGWLVGTGELALARVLPGPGTADEVRRMVLTSGAIPPAAVYHRLRGELRHRTAGPWRGAPDLVLLDRDGTLVQDVPYNADPDEVRPMAGAAAALARLRAEGIRTGVVTNQSGVARGLIAAEELQAVNDRVEELLGPFDGWYVCCHGPEEGCGCRKPEPGLVSQACAEHGVDPGCCVVVGDIGSDLGAARAAGASGVLVPTPETRADEVAAAPRVAPTLGAAVDLVLGGRW